MIKTTCKECVFNHGTESIECYLNRYEKFKELNQIDETGEITRLCSTCRDENWAHSFYKERKELPLPEELKEKVYFELTNVFSLLIIDDEGGDVRERLIRTLSVKQTIAPRQIIFVYNGDTPLAEVSSILEHNFPKKYNVSKVFDNEYERQMIDLAAKKAEGLYYTVVQSGEVLLEDALESIHKLVNIRLDRVVLITGESLTGLTVLRGLHHHLDGNFGDLIEKKFYKSIKEGEELLTKTWTQVYNELASNSDFYRGIS